MGSIVSLSIRTLVGRHPRGERALSFSPSPCFPEFVRNFVLEDLNNIPRSIVVAGDVIGIRVWAYHEREGGEKRPEWHLLRLREQHLHNRRALPRLRRNSGCIPFPTRLPLSSLSRRPRRARLESIGCHSLRHCEQDGRVDAQLLKNTPTRGCRLVPSLRNPVVAHKEEAALNDKNVRRLKGEPWIGNLYQG